MCIRDRFTWSVEHGRPQRWVRRRRTRRRRRRETTMSAATLRIAGCLCAATMLGILVGCGDAKNSEAAAKAPSVPGQAFASPEEAAAALVSAAEKYDVPTLKTILGSDGQPIVQSGDSVRDRNDLIAV